MLKMANAAYTGINLSRVSHSLPVSMKQALKYLWNDITLLYLPNDIALFKVHVSQDAHKSNSITICQTLSILLSLKRKVYILSKIVALS